jgi:hypothetical protein
MAADFGNTIFQSNPFENITARSTVVHQLEASGDLTTLGGTVDRLTREARSLVYFPKSPKELKPAPIAGRFAQLSQRFSESQAASMRRLMGHLHNVTTRHKITYVMDGGTLIGSLLHHGRIPWDDDLDAYINSEDEHKFIKALSTNGFLVRNWNGLYLKMWDQTLPHVRNNRKHNWPFLDVGLLVKNKTHIWERRSKREKKYSGNVYPRSMIYPPVLRPFGDLILAAPRDGEAMLTMRLGPFWRERCGCGIANWDHRLENILDQRVGDGNARIFYPCGGLPDLPLVRREPQPSGIIQERVLVNGRTVKLAIFDPAGSFVRWDPHRSSST